MKPTSSILTVVLTVIPFSFLLFILPRDLYAQTEPTSPKTEINLRLMSFNIRNGRAKDGVNQWENRKDFVCDVIKDNSPDIVGLQEAFHFQLEYILEKLPDYKFVGVGRDGGKQGEYSAILYLEERFNVKKSETFWLSDTPEKKSRSWGNRYFRICTWTRLEDKRTRRSFDIFNTHFDHQSQNARIRSAALIAKRIANRTSPAPFVLMGDLNAGEDNEVVRYLKGKSKQANSPVQLKDTYRVLHPNEKKVGTGGGFGGRTDGPKIDYILVPDSVRAKAASIIRIQRSGKFPSDHFPVFATVEF